MSKILIVDDESVTTLVAATFLRDEGFEVETADSGHDALEILETFLPDLLISDLRIDHDMDGVDLAVGVLTKNQNCKIIFLSGLPEQAEEKAAALKVPVSKYLGKPCDFERLVGIVKEVLE